MGRTNKSSDAALKAAADMLATTKNDKLKVQLIKITLDYELQQKENAAKKHAAAEKTAGGKASENKLPAGSPSSVQAVIDQLAENNQVLRAQFKKVEQAVEELRQGVKNAKEEAETARKEAHGVELRLKFINKVMEHVANALSAENRDRCASELFHNFKTAAPELLATLFKTLGLNLETWHAWDKHYGDNAQLMVQAFESREKHGPAELFLLRLKLSALGIDVDAINAVRDYRDRKISFEELEGRTRPHIEFRSGRPVKNGIPVHLRPRLSEQALRDATQALNKENDKAKKLQWLEIVRELLQPDSGVGVCLAMEIRSTLF